MREMDPERSNGGQIGDEQHSPEPLFSLGQIVGTPGALNALLEADQSPVEFLTRHVRGDWGDLVEEDQEQNNYSVKNELRILSAYRLNTGERIWVITEWDRSVTTVLLPEEY
jgi:hypothetical protein